MSENPNAILRELRETHDSQSIAEHAAKCGMELKDGTLYGDAEQWAALRDTFGFSDLIFG